MGKSGHEFEAGAIYCRISHAKDDDQTGVDRQERICRDMAARLNVRVDPRHVYVDNSRSAWKRNRKRPGWDQLLTAIKAGEVKHVLTYHPDRLMRQPWDLEELLRLAEDSNIILHGQANRRDLSNADDRFFLRIEVAHACKSSDDTSRRVKSAQADALTAGKPHGGRRAYGYTSGMASIIEEEAEIVREIYRRFLDGDAIWAIYQDLTKRGIRSAGGGDWSTQRIRQLLDSPRHAGLIVFRDEVQKDETGAYRKGAWPAIVSVGEWEEAARLRQRRTRDYEDARRNYHPYLLTGMVICTRCTRSMVGTKYNGKPCYLCTCHTVSSPLRCKRRIRAGNLEEFVKDAAKDFLTKLSAADLVATTATADSADNVKVTQDDERKLEEIREMWDANEITTAEMREMQSKIKKRMAARQRATVIRPLTALEGVVIGPGAAEAFDELSTERQAGVLRFLFPAVRIEAASTRGVFDYSRIKIDPPQL